LLFNVALHYAIRRVQENQQELKLNGTHQRLAYADDVNILAGNIDTIQRNKEVDTSKEVRLEVNPEKTKYMLMLRFQKAGQSIRIVNRSFEYVAKFRIFGNNSNKSKLNA
jgi:hypothetical protein